MESQAQVDAIEEALQRLGVKVRYEELPDEVHVDGGLCTVRGEQLVYVAPSAPLGKRAQVLLNALRQLPHERVWLPPQLRAKLETGTGW